MMLVTSITRKHHLAIHEVWLEESINQRVKIRTRSDESNPYGMGSQSDHLLKASASSLCLPAICCTSNSIENVADSKHNFSTKRHCGCFGVSSLLLPLSAPVLSLKELILIGTLWPGKVRANVKTIAICARSSNAEIIFCKSSSIGIWRAVKSCLTNRSENQKHWCEAVRIKPPMPHTSAFANASAAANPHQRGLGRSGTKGDECSSQCWYNARIRSEFFVRIRLSVPRSRIRIQIRRWEIRMFWRSHFEATSWCRTDTNVESIGMAEEAGCRLNCSWSVKQSGSCDQYPGSML